MKLKSIVLLSLLLFSIDSFSQNLQKVFWQEQFNNTKLPEGWVSVDKSKTGKCSWLVTDQPYPGSFQFNQQQPPIASTSRGFHLQYRPGLITGDQVTNWNQNKQYPNAYVQTSAIDCHDKDKVILKFQHIFRWNNWFTAKEAGLYVGVSNDGKKWTEFNVKKSLSASTTIRIPIKEEINISKIAANQEKVFLRFYWRGIFSWFWMIDDIELCEPLSRDVAISSLTSHKVDDNNFTSHDTLRVKVTNFGALPINEDLKVNVIINDNEKLETVAKFNKAPLGFNESREITFPPTDLSKLGANSLKFNVELEGDEKLDNNVYETKIYASQMHLGNITGFRRLAKNEYEFSSNFSKAKLIFYSDDIFRLWLAPNGEYTNPAANQIVVDYSKKKSRISFSNHKEYYKFKTNKCIVRIYKKPFRVGLYSLDKKLIFEEAQPITFGTKTFQTLKRANDEHFYGGGMQHGNIDHANQKIDISWTGWDDKKVSNPVPFYMSSKGYGVYRNTFSPGEYSFNKESQSQKEIDGLQMKVMNQESKLMHSENRFDAFYFFGPSLKQVLNSYTDITGKPFMPAYWMLTMGDADCYNNLEQRVKWKQSTPDVISQIADEYIKHDMPRGWILPNDGYGCGYQKLDSVVKELKKRGFHTGLWTENGVDKIAYEVGTCGTRLCKLDVAWIGAGYEFALNGCKTAFDGIQNNTNERGFVWSVCGWAGTQRYSTIWSGDQVSNWDYIKYHIPTIAGTGLSGFNAATSDIDGIFGGSARTYTRDLQWKCFTPIMMCMSGWAEVDRQPWLYGHPYEAINRDFLKLKMRLMPYAYSYCREAHETGVPMVRAMMLEFPEDNITYTDSTKYQFMSGEYMLVAPIYKRGNTRDSIYLPKGKWYDYWNNKKYEGNQWIKKYEARLDKCPVFIKEGAIIPMWPDMNYVGQKSIKELTLCLWPSEEQSNFVMYEDDGITRDHEKGQFATTKIALMKAKNRTTLTIFAAKGDFKERLHQRVYSCEVNNCNNVEKVLLNEHQLSKVESKFILDKGSEGYYFDKSLNKLFIKTSEVSTDKTTKINIY